METIRESRRLPELEKKERKRPPAARAPRGLDGMAAGGQPEMYLEKSIQKQIRHQP